jgi:hypothetical protein
MSDDNYGDEGRGDDADEIDDNEENYESDLSNSLDKSNEEAGEGESD